MKDGKYVILCIDDDPDVLMVLQTVLEGAGYQYEGAESAEEGLKAFKEHNPDLIIVDLMMEEVDAGKSFVKEVRTENKTLPIYMLSSIGDALSTQIDTSELGLNGVFQKPIDNNTLIKTLESKLK